MAASEAGMKAAHSCSQQHCCGSGTWDLRSFDKDGGGPFLGKKSKYGRTSAASSPDTAAVSRGCRWLVLHQGAEQVFVERR